MDVKKLLLSLFMFVVLLMSITGVYARSYVSDNTNLTFTLNSDLNNVDPVFYNGSIVNNDNFNVRIKDFSYVLYKKVGDDFIRVNSFGLDSFDIDSNSKFNFDVNFGVLDSAIYRVNSAGKVYTINSDNSLGSFLGFVSNRFLFKVSDSGLSENNFVPVLEPIMDQEVCEGDNFTYQVVASDADGLDNLIYDVSLNYLSISDTGLISTVKPLDFASSGVSVIVSDGQFSDSTIFQLVMVDNFPPVLTSIPDFVIESGFALSEKVVVYDNHKCDSGNLFYTLNDTRYFDVSSDGVIFSKGVVPVGNYSLNLTVSDGEFIDYDVFNIKVVEHINHAPVVDDISDKSVLNNESFSLQINAVDPDGDSLSYSIIGLDGLSVSESGLITGSNLPIGSYIIEYSVSDGDLISSGSFRLVVVDSNIGVVDLVINSSDVMNFCLDEHKSYVLDVNREGDVSYSFISKKQGMSIIGDVLSWTPSFTGNFVVKIKAQSGLDVAYKNISVVSSKCGGSSDSSSGSDDSDSSDSTIVDDDNFFVDNVKVKYDGDSERLSLGESVDIANGDDFTLDFDVNNKFDFDLKHVEVEVDWDSDDKSKRIGTLDKGDDEGLSFDIQLDNDYDEDDEIDFEIIVTAEDDDGNEYKSEFDFVVDITAKDYDIKIKDVSLPSVVKCGSRHFVNVKMENIGAEDDFVKLKVYSTNYERRSEGNVKIDSDDTGSVSVIYEVPKNYKGNLDVFFQAISVEDSDRDYDLFTKTIFVNCDDDNFDTTKIDDDSKKTNDNLDKGKGNSDESGVIISLDDKPKSIFYGYSLNSKSGFGFSLRSFFNFLKSFF